MNIKVKNDFYHLSICVIIHEEGMLKDSTLQSWKKILKPVIFFWFRKNCLNSKAMEKYKKEPKQSSLCRFKISAESLYCRAWQGNDNFSITWAANWQPIVSQNTKYDSTYKFVISKLEKARKERVEKSRFQSESFSHFSRMINNESLIRKKKHFSWYDQLEKQKNSLGDIFESNQEKQIANFMIRYQKQSVFECESSVGEKSEMYISLYSTRFSLYQINLIPPTSRSKHRPLHKSPAHKCLRS